MFCGRSYGKEVTRKIRPKNLVSGQELIITFWSDASFAGDGFDGYFVDLRRRTDLKTCPFDDENCPRVDVSNIGK